MADSFEKRARERRKQMKRREKAERKRERDATKTDEPEVLTPDHWFADPDEIDEGAPDSRSTERGDNPA